MADSLGLKGRPVYRARSTENDPPVDSPKLHPVTSEQDGRDCTDTITTVTNSEARIRVNRAEAAETGKKNGQGLYKNEDRTCTTRSVPTSTRDVHARETAASSGKRKLDKSCPESLPAAKRIHGTGKERHEKRSEHDPANKYEYLTRNRLREKCWSRSLQASGSKEDLIKRLILDDNAQAQTSTSHESAKKNVTSYTASRAEPSDRYTNMLLKDLWKECAERSIPTGLTKRDTRRCLRFYDAARALGLTPEESLEAQRAHLIEEHDRSVSPQGSIEEITLGAASEEAVEGHTLGITPRESTVDDRQRPASLGSSSTNSPASSEKDIASSSATTQDSAYDPGTPETCPGRVATPNYATMGAFELRSLCRSRSLKQHGFSAPQLRRALTAYDRKSSEEANNAGVAVNAKHPIAELGDAPTASPSPVAFTNLDSSSQHGKAPEQRTRSLLVPTGAQAETRQRGSMKRTRAETFSEKDSFISPYSPRLVLKPPKRVGNESTPQRTPYHTGPMSPRQPLVSLLNLTIKEARSDTGNSTHQDTQMKIKPLSGYAIKMAEKQEFNARYATEAPSWICCCGAPGYEVRHKQPAEFSGNCFYHVSRLAQRGSFTMKEYQEYQITQQALDRIASCLCQKSAADHPEHQVTITEGGFILAQIWREQLIRRHSLATFRPNMAAYRRKGILEVMHNVLEDFMIELSSRQHRRPLVLWARMEAMAWFINTLPTSNEWHYFQDWRRPCHYIMLFGIALLTTIDALLQQNLFKDKESKVPNLGLVLALFIQSTGDLPSITMDLFDSKDSYRSPFNNDICVNNENGWAAEVVRLADQHGIEMNRVKGIDVVVDQWRLRKKSIDSIRDRPRKELYAVLHSGETLPPSEATLASTAAKEGGTPAQRGIGQRTTVRAFRISI